jgi:hypothetical protein
MKIIDNFLFCNEYDILELRLKVMGDKVDQFNIVECNKTFTGIYKGFNLEKQLDRFAPWMNKINYIKVTDPPIGTPWSVEDWQRDQYARGWKNISDQDVMLISDCDEIIRPEAIDFIKNTKYNFYGLYMPAFYFKFNYLDTKPNWHYKVWARAFRNFRGATPGRLKYLNEHDLIGCTTIRLHHAGWHFGWLGDDEFVKKKIASFSHTEINRPDVINNVNIEQHIKEGRDHFRPENVTWTAVDLDDYFPKEILENKEKYADYILPDSDKTVRQYWTKEILEQE